MTTYADFDAAEAEQKGEPLTFKAGGEMFEALRLSASPFLRFCQLAADQGDLPEEEAAIVFSELITSSLKEEDRDRFNEAARKFSASTLMGIATWLLSQSTGRPTTPLSRSDAPQRKTSPSLNGGSLSTAAS